MERESSYAVTARIARIIAEDAPTVAYTPEDVRDALDAYGEEQLERMRQNGFFADDFEPFYVVSRFLEQYGLKPYLDRAYAVKLYGQARKFSPSYLADDAYMRAVTVPEKRIGKFLLTNVPYARGEIFQYDMPTVTEALVTPKLGFFTQKVTFPSVYEGEMPWVSVCPSEMASMAPDIPAARGKCLVLGLGLGYYAFHIAQNPAVSAITVVEHSRGIIKLFEDVLLPQFPNREKIRVAYADAFAFLENVREGDYDFCYADIWESDIDGAAAYQRIKPQDDRLAGTLFRYWIEKEIKERLKHP